MSVIFRLERAETTTNEDARHCCGADPHELLPKLIAYLTIQKGKKAVVLGSSSQRLVRTAHGYCRKSSKRFNRGGGPVSCRPFKHRAQVIGSAKAVTP
jgi:hypothetical protein